MARLSVDLNRERIYDIALQPSFQTDGPFEVQLDNHGQAVHIHLSLDDSLSEIATLEETNQYVDTDSQQLVRVQTTAVSAPVTGRLTIVTGYGAESTTTSVTVSPPGTRTDRVAVDERLSQPTKTEPTESSLRERFDGIALERLDEITLDRLSLPLLGFSALVIGLVLVIAAIADSVIVLGGSIVVVGVVIALALTHQR